MKNREIQALHQVLTVYEQSKINTDRILDSMPTVFFIIDQNNLILRGNLDASTLFGCTSAQLIGRDFFSLFDEFGRAFFESHFERIKKKELERASFDLEWQHSSGVTRVFVWDIAPLEGPFSKGQPYRVMGRDVTDFRKQIADAVALSKEFEVMSAVQSLFLPNENGVSTTNFDIASYYRPAERVGGDWWRSDQDHDDHLLLVLADVSGHGVGAAMITGVVGSSYNLIRNLCLQQPSEIKTRRILELINLNLSQICSGRYWFSISVVEIFIEKNELHFWNAGGPPIYIKKANGDFLKLNKVSRPLGGDIQQLDPICTEFLPGDRCFVYSDGIFDFEQSDGDYFSLQKLKRIFEHEPIQDVNEMLSSILKKLKAYEKPTEHTLDDRTLIVVGRK